MDELSFRMSCIGKPDAWNEGPLDESKVEIMNRWLGSLARIAMVETRLVCDGARLDRLDGGRWKVGTSCTSSKRPGPFFFSFWVPIVTGPDQKISDAASSIFLVGKCGSRGLLARYCAYLGPVRFLISIILSVLVRDISRYCFFLGYHSGYGGRIWIDKFRKVVAGGGVLMGLHVCVSDFGHVNCGGRRIFQDAYDLYV